MGGCVSRKNILHSSETIIRVSHQKPLITTNVQVHKRLFIRDLPKKMKSLRIWKNTMTFIQEKV